MTCETAEENRDNIQWIFNGRYVVDGDFDQDFKINKNILKIKNIQLYHTGQYECSGMDKLLRLIFGALLCPKEMSSNRPSIISRNRPVLDIPCTLERPFTFVSLERPVWSPNFGRENYPIKRQRFFRHN